MVNPVENRAAEAQFSKMFGGGHCRPAERMCVEWGMGGLRCCKVGMSERAREGYFGAPQRKRSCGGSVFKKDERGVMRTR
jgi:hypothetical protein